MSENSNLPVQGYHLGRFWDCRLCGKKIKRGEEFVLTGTRPMQWLYLTSYDMWTQISEKSGHMYHEKCYEIKKRQEAEYQKNIPESEQKKTQRDYRHVKSDNEFNF
jgi:hypothetical protein